MLPEVRHSPAFGAGTEGFFLLLLGDFGGIQHLWQCCPAWGRLLWAWSWCSLQGISSGQQLLQAGAGQWQELSPGGSCRLLEMVQRRDSPREGISAASSNGNPTACRLHSA